MDYEKEMDRLKYAHEGEVANLEIANKRLFILCLVIFIALILTNGAWIYHESLYQDVIEETYTTTTDGDNAVFVNGNGDLHYNDKDNVQEDTDTTTENP